MPVIKKNEKLRVRIDFRDLNKATPTGEYHMPIVEMLIDSTAGSKLLNFMDGYSYPRKMCRKQSFDALKPLALMNG